MPDSELSAIIDGTARGRTTHGAGRGPGDGLCRCRIASSAQSAITQKKLLKTALIHSFGKASVERRARRRHRAINILHNDMNGQRYVTTKDVLHEEQAMIDFARDGQGPRATSSAAMEPSSARSAIKR